MKHRYIAKEIKHKTPKKIVNHTGEQDMSILSSTDDILGLI